MTKRDDLIKSTARESGISQANCEKVIDALIAVLRKKLINGEKILLRNFMSIEITEMAGRNCKHPYTGEEITLPPTKVVRCRPSASLKADINNK